jgi:23S rRNA (guanine745-N1)-methyltransferase
MVDILCTVRGCGKVLSPDTRGRMLSCPAGHGFNVARSGYVNLLQPQDRRARLPGDSAEAVAARRRLLDAGGGAALLAALAEAIAAAGLPHPARTLDLGAGEGFFLGALQQRFGFDAVGLDLSARATDLAARRYPGARWLVANADRRLPFADAAFDLVLSTTARRNPAECARVLAPSGRLIVTIPAPDDQGELREAVLGTAHAVDRTARVLAEHGDRFVLADRRAARELRHFSAEGIEDLLIAGYRGGRAGRRERAAALDGLTVTLSHTIIVLQAKTGT